MGEQGTSGSEGGGKVAEAQAPAKKGAADPRLQGISDAIRVVPHFPKPGPSVHPRAKPLLLGVVLTNHNPPVFLSDVLSSGRPVVGAARAGIMFNDITALLLRPGVFKDAVDLFVERYRGMGIAAVAGIEARGFIFGPAIALAIGAKFIPLRKPGKLPGAVISENYTLEYGTDCLEMHVGAVEPGDRVVVVDDLVATGGTLSAAIKLLEHAAADVVECACLIGLPKFKVRKG
uniref:adenine phosphoribosyltransferase n=1 Tax=Triticum urartu TaxID=4572 RepID=A0A8R7PH10_TRIUA